MNQRPTEMWLICQPVDNAVLVYLWHTDAGVAVRVQKTKHLSQGFYSCTNQEASWGGKGLFSLHFHIDVQHTKPASHTKSNLVNMTSEFQERIGHPLTVPGLRAVKAFPCEGLAAVAPDGPQSSRDMTLGALLCTPPPTYCSLLKPTEFVTWDNAIYFNQDTEFPG